MTPEEQLALHARKGAPMNRPNLFFYATSELSQDAFICWFFSWASPEYKNTDKDLHQCALNFVQALFEKHSRIPPSEIRKVDIFKQENYIDVLCVINGIYAILIEDKTGTKNHSNQLDRYLENVKKRNFEEVNVFPIYLKTEDQGNYSDVLNAGYKLYLRSDFLRTLKTHSGNNAILIDYRDYLQSISDEVESYKLLPIEKWGWYSWVGFYLRLQKELATGNWDYVPNPSGGFLGFWLYSQGDEECEQYLQLEEDKFCFKIWVNKVDDRSKLRDKWYKIIKARGSEYDLKLIKPARFGNGEYMTVCIHDGEYRVFDINRVVDIEKTVQRIRKAETLLEAVNASA